MPLRERAPALVWEKGIPNRWIITLKVLVHVACLLPIAWLVWGLFGPEQGATLGPDPTAYVTFFTGRGTLRILVLSLAVTPVLRLVPRLSWLIRFRRMLGLYAFFYGSLHLLTYLGLYAGFSWAAIVDDLKKRPYIWAGVTSWSSMLPLALTSTTWSIRTLGGKQWRLLHRLVYVAAIAGVVHYWWIVKPGVRSPMLVTIVLGILLVSRPLLARLQAYRRNALVAGATARKAAESAP